MFWLQVFPKAGTPEAKTSVERVITVAHDDLQMLMKAVQKVLEKVAADPQHANTHEKDFGGNESVSYSNYIYFQKLFQSVNNIFSLVQFA